MKSMKTNLFPLLLLLSLLFAMACRKPALPNGDPTISKTRTGKPAVEFPWRVVKGSRLATHFTPARTPRTFL